MPSWVCRLHSSQTSGGIGGFEPGGAIGRVVWGGGGRSVGWFPIPQQHSSLRVAGHAPPLRARYGPPSSAGPLPPAGMALRHTRLIWIVAVTAVRAVRGLIFFGAHCRETTLAQDCIDLSMRHENLRTDASRSQALQPARDALCDGLERIDRERSECGPRPHPGEDVL